MGNARGRTDKKREAWRRSGHRPQVGGRGHGGRAFHLLSASEIQSIWQQLFDGEGILQLRRLGGDREVLEPGREERLADLQHELELLGLLLSNYAADSVREHPAPEHAGKPQPEPAIRLDLRSRSHERVVARWLEGHAALYAHTLSSTFGLAVEREEHGAGQTLHVRGAMAGALCAGEAGVHLVLLESGTAALLRVTVAGDGETRTTMPFERALVSRVLCEGGPLLDLRTGLLTRGGVEQRQVRSLLLSQLATASGGAS